MHTRVTVVSLSVCLCVCSQSTDCLRGLHSEMNIPADFSQNVEDFQLRDFFEMLSFKTYSFIRSFQRAKAAIFTMKRAHDTINGQVQLRILSVLYSASASTSVRRFARVKGLAGRPETTST